MYWHSDRVREDKLYHYKKYIDCKNIGVQLLYIWEDDYLDRKDIVIRTLKRKLGVSNERKVNARDCKVYEESYGEVKEFLNKNHIQGSASGSLYLSLRDEDNKRVAVAVFQDNDDGTTLLKRYATSCNVRGGFTKLIEALNRAYDYIGVYTFSDNGISDGSLYSESGFVKVKDIPPDYSYAVDRRRVHKFNYRLSRFEKDPFLFYDANMSESQLAEINGLPRVYDAGKVKWYKSFE